MTIALILAGHRYKMTPASAGFNYTSDGHSLAVGEIFTASTGAMFNDGLKMGMMRGHIVELFDQALVADRDARLLELKQAMGLFAGVHSCQGADSILVYNAVQTEELETDDDAFYGIVLSQPTEGATTFTGSALDKASPAVFQAQINGVNNGTAVSATGGSPPYAISATGLTAVVAGDLAALYAKDSTDSSRLTNNVSKTVKYATPVITQPLQGVATVSGTTGSPNGAILTLYQDSTAIKTVTISATPAWSATGIAGSVLVGAGSLTAVVGAGTPKASTASTAVLVKFNPPVVNSPILDADTEITGTSDGAIGTTITVYSNAVSIGTTTVTVGGVWTLTTDPILGEAITAKAGLATAQSAASNSVTVT
jgi:hypothetical protein